MNLSHRQRGFSLLEVMLALAVFLIGFTGLMGLQIASVKHTRHANDLSLASNLAANEIEELRLEEFSAIQDTYTSWFDKYGAELPDSTGAFYTVSVTTALGTGNSYREVTVNCGWSYGAAGATVSNHNVLMRSRVIQ